MEALKNTPMDPTAMFKLSYGLFVLSACEGGKDNGCIINTVTQVTTTPNRITIAVNRANHTHDMILRTNAFNLSIISEKAGFDLFKRFGFCSGRDTDKLKEAGLSSECYDGVPLVSEARMAVICKKLYADFLKEDCLISKELLSNYAAGDVHRMYEV